MEESVILLSEALVPGVGPMLTALSAVRQLYTSMQESNALCDSVQTRLDTFWHTLLEMERHKTLPPNFKLADFTDIVQRFHALVVKQAQKSLLVRVGTTPSFMDKLRECHDELDQLGESLRLHSIHEAAQWRTTWEREENLMSEEITRIAASGNATRMAIGGVPESIEALATLVHEQQKLPNQAQLVEALQAICFQLAREKKLTLPASMPSWFFTFDDIDIDSEPFRSPSTPTAMGTVHRGRWGVHTPVIVKRITLPPSKKLSTTGNWKEADVWWKLSHPNVLRMYGACHVTQPAFIVCEEATHGNIRDYLARDPHNLRRFWRLQLDVAVGLSHLRRHNVVHGNLKPTNILIGDDGRAKITDFGFSFIRTTDDTEENDTVMTDESEQDSVAVAPYDSSRAAPELRAAVDRGRAVESSFESDVYAFAVCIVELLTRESSWNGRQFLSKNTLQTQRPRAISDEAWDLIQQMSCQDPHKRPTIQQVTKRIQRLAEHETEVEKYFSSSSSEGDAASNDVDARRHEYFQQQRPETHRQQPPQSQSPQHEQLNRELEVLRQKIRQEERKLESVMEKRYRVETQPAGASENTTVSPSTPTKQLLRLLRWGTTDEQTQALRIMDKDQVEHSAMEIFRHNGLDIIVACMKHGHSSEFRQTAIDILQSISTAGNGLYLDAVLEHGVTQVLMGVLHYRRVAVEQRRAGQFLVVLATRSSRVRSLFVQNAGLELLIKVLWDNQLPMFDRHLKSRCEASVINDMRKFLAAHGEPRWKDADRAMERYRDKETALQKYTEAIVLDPRNGRLYAKRSAVYYAFRKFEHAAMDAQQCIRFLPQYGEGYFRHAIALYALNQVAQADRAVREGRTFDLQYFDSARMSELALHAPRERGLANQRAWDMGSVEF